ncbi:MAG: MerR family transcriptional regulator [Clostridiales bacterium]|nr:MerR family transcriptional regulator [Clostridiales bacterium]
MDIRNCRRCNKIFQYRGSKYCPSCMLDLDQIFIKVRDYIYENPNATIVDVSQEVGVEEDIILEFLKAGRLELSSPGLDYLCERCDTPIVTGRFCNNCIKDLEREMKKGLGESAQTTKKLGKDSNRMYTADLRHKKRGI